MMYFFLFNLLAKASACVCVPLCLNMDVEVITWVCGRDMCMHLQFECFFYVVYSQEHLHLYKFESPSTHIFQLE